MVKFNWNGEIQLELRFSVEMEIFSWNDEIQLEWWNCVEMVKLSWNGKKEKDFYKVYLGVGFLENKVI